MSNQYYIKRGDKVRGPVSETRLNELLAEGKLREPDLVSLRNDGGWKPIEKMRETFLLRRDLHHQEPQSQHRRRYLRYDIRDLPDSTSLPLPPGVRNSRCEFGWTERKSKMGRGSLFRAIQYCHPV